MKIPPKSLYTTKDDSNPGSGNELEEEPVTPYDIENTFEKLDYEDRKWLLFQLVLCNPIFLEEVMLGFPMSLVGDDDVVNRSHSGDGNEAIGFHKIQTQSSGTIEDERLRYEEECEGSDISGDIPGKEDDPLLELTDLSLGVNEEERKSTEKVRLSGGDKEEGKQKQDDGNESARLADKDKKAELLPILVPESEWLLTYCQIDAIPSSTRDTFLLNLFLMSPAHSSILQSFSSSLESGRLKHEEYDTYPDEIEWKDRFNEVNEGRRVLAKAGMEVDCGSVGYWEELGEGREGVWDVALCEIGGWLMRDLPGPAESDGGKSPEVDDGIGKQTDMRADPEGSDKWDEYFQERGSQVDEPEWHHTPESRIAQDNIKMMGFIIQTKTLSLVRQLTRPDSASDYLPGQYQYKAITINDMVKLSVLLTRSPLPLRKL
jgi:hypothetical protein